MAVSPGFHPRSVALREEDGGSVPQEMMVVVEDNSRGGRRGDGLDRLDRKFDEIKDRRQG